MKSIPRSAAMSMIANASDWSRWLPKIIVPRQSLLTCSPLRPTRMPSISAVQSSAARAVSWCGTDVELAEEPVLLLSELVEEPRPLTLDIVPAERLVPRNGSFHAPAIGESEGQEALLPRHLVALGESIHRVAAGAVQLVARFQIPLGDRDQLGNHPAAEVTRRPAL